MAESPKEAEPGTGFDIGSAERVMEGNWEWLRAEGFRPYETLPQEELEYAEWKPYWEKFGGGNVRQGDVYDPESDRPLRNIPGVTIYVRDEPPADPPAQSGKAGA
jgi:hypothetical protein